jgi:hypothetical protein
LIYSGRALAHATNGFAVESDIFTWRTFELLWRSTKYRPSALWKSYPLNTRSQIDADNIIITRRDFDPIRKKQFHSHLGVQTA